MLGIAERRLAELAGHPPGDCAMCRAAGRVMCRSVWVGVCRQREREPNVT